MMLMMCVMMRHSCGSRGRCIGDRVTLLPIASQLFLVNVERFQEAWFLVLFLLYFGFRLFLLYGMRRDDGFQVSLEPCIKALVISVFRRRALLRK